MILSLSARNWPNLLELLHPPPPPPRTFPPSSHKLLSVLLYRHSPVLLPPNYRQTHSTCFVNRRRRPSNISNRISPLQTSRLNSACDGKHCRMERKRFVRQSMFFSSIEWIGRGGGVKDERRFMFCADFLRHRQPGPRTLCIESSCSHRCGVGARKCRGEWRRPRVNHFVTHELHILHFELAQL